jgi:hypothetical protein
MGSWADSRVPPSGECAVRKDGRPREQVGEVGQNDTPGPRSQSTFSFFFYSVFPFSLTFFFVPNFEFKFCSEFVLRLGCMTWAFHCELSLLIYKFILCFIVFLHSFPFSNPNFKFRF